MLVVNREYRRSCDYIVLAIRLICQLEVLIPLLLKEKLLPIA